MKNMFPEYLQPNEEKKYNWWKSGIFIFDTSVLLDIYRYSISTRDEFLEILDELKERIFIPHQVAYEFLKNRPGVIHGQIAVYTTAKNIIEGTSYDINEKIKKELNIKHHPFIDIDEFQKRVNDVHNEILNDIEEKKIAYEIVLSEDSLLDRISELFEGNVGDGYEDQVLEEIYEEGKERYLKKIPPGYMDSVGPNKKEGNEIYGDLVIWKQIIDKAKEVNKTILFITNDEKEDWWWITKGKKIGPRPELIKEIMNNERIPFHMYNSINFMKYAKQYLKIDIDQGAIDEVSDLYIQAFDKVLFTDYIKKISLEDYINTYKNSILDDEKLWDLIIRKWPDILIEIRDKYPNLGKLLIYSTPKKVENGTLIIEFQSEYHKELALEFLKKVEEVSSKVIGFPIKIIFTSVN